MMMYDCWFHCYQIWQIEKKNKVRTNNADSDFGFDRIDLSDMDFSYHDAVL